MASAKGKSVVSAEMPDDVRTALAKRAKRENRSVSASITRAVVYWINHCPVERKEPEPPPLARNGAKS